MKSQHGHVYICTYERNNPPALPAELVETDPVAVPAVVEDTCKHDQHKQETTTLASFWLINHYDTDGYKL